MEVEVGYSRLLSFCIGLIVIVFLACVGLSSSLVLTLDIRFLLWPRSDFQLALSSLSVITMPPVCVRVALWPTVCM